MSKRVILTFKEDGTIEANAEGWTGKLCVTETDRLLKTLDGKVEQRKLKREFNVEKQQDTVGVHG